jgi:hypothetical protein
MCAGQERGTCVSQGSRFPRFQLEGHPPRKVYKGSEDLTLCRFYRKQTCCSSLQTNAALALLARLATGGEASPECLALWEVLECSICDPHIGVSPGPPLLCASLCDSLFAACSDAYFSADPIHQNLVPCGGRDTVCARAREWASNSSDFCTLTGFRLEGLDTRIGSRAQLLCYDGKPESLTALTDAKPASRRGIDKDRPSNSLLNMLNDWIEHLEVPEMVLWAIGGFVLTAGAVFLRRRSSNSRHKRNALFLRAKALQEQKERRQVLAKSATARATKKN